MKPTLHYIDNYIQIRIKMDGYPRYLTSNRKLIRKIRIILDDLFDEFPKEVTANKSRAYRFRKILWWSFIGFIQTNILGIKE